MAERQLDPLSQLLGEIKAGLDTVIKTQGEDRTAAAQYRTAMHVELKEMHDEVRANANEVKTLRDQFVEVKDKVEKLEAAAHQSSGARHILASIGKAAGLFWAAAGSAVALIANHYWK